MKSFLILILTLWGAALTAAEKPKLVLALTIDQFRYDYLVRFRGEYAGGLHRLLTQGAVFTNAQYDHFPTVTAVGHSTFLSGATPSVSGIIGNDWWDRLAGRNVTSVTDDAAKLLGGTGEAGSSPRRMLVSTLGDEMKIANGGKSRSIGISWKDRSAILPVGHTADAAYWVEKTTGFFVSSTFYFADLPAWVKDINASQPSGKYLRAEWNLAPHALKIHKMPAEPGEKFIKAIQESPFSNEMLEAFAERAISAEQLGQRGVTDLLALSLSANDYVGHEMGPDSPEVHAISVHTDKLLDKLFRFLEGAVGMKNVLVVLTSDHGVAPVPEVNAARKMPGGRMPKGMIQDTVQKHLAQRFGEGKWVVSPSEHSLYFNDSLIRERGLDEREVHRAAAAAVATMPHVARVYTRAQLVAGIPMEDPIGRRIMNGYNRQRGADVVILLEPYWMYGATGTTHGTPYMYDAHIPVIFMGPGVKPGVHRRRIVANDIAPTLATLLDVEPPSGATGRVLDEILGE